MARQRRTVAQVARVRLRWLLRRFDRRHPGWLAGLTPWGTSLAIHGLILLVLGLAWFIHAEATRPPHQIDGQLTDDVTSLGRSDHSGDPFSTLQTAEAPSLRLDPAQADAEVTNVPELPESFRLGAELNIRPPGPSGLARKGAKGKSGARLAMNSGRASTGGGGDGAGEMVPQTTAPYSSRSPEMKAKLLKREGGTVESERAVAFGVSWLARHQRRDGSWSLDTTPACPKSPGCPSTPFGDSDVAATGLALLPIMGAGHTHMEPGRYQLTLQKGLHWLLKHQNAGGELFTGGGRNTAMYTHAIATMALCEAYGMTHDPKLREPVRKALGNVASTQNKVDGGWRYFVGEPSDTSVFGWDLFALRSGKMAGIPPSKVTINLCKQYLDLAATDSSRTEYAYIPGMGPRPSMTAEGLLGRQILGWPRDHPALVQGVAGVAAHLESFGQRHTYYWYYATQLLHNQGGPEWPRWNERIREELIGTQVLGDGCDHGSWDPTRPQFDYEMSRGGRLVITSLSLLTLEVYYRYLPMYREPDDGLDDPATPEKPAGAVAKGAIPKAPAAPAVAKPPAAANVAPAGGAKG